MPASAARHATRDDAGFLVIDRMSRPSGAEGSGEDVIGDEERQVAAAGIDVLVFTNPNLPTRNVGEELWHIRADTRRIRRPRNRLFASEAGSGRDLQDLLFPKNITIDDVLANSTVQALNNYLQKAVPQNIKMGHDAGSGHRDPASRRQRLGMLGSAIPLIIRVIEKLKGDRGGERFSLQLSPRSR